LLTGLAGSTDSVTVGASLPTPVALTIVIHADQAVAALPRSVEYSVECHDGADVVSLRGERKVPL
jgi:hypothetical protein